MSLNQFIIIRIINSLSTDFRVSINPSQSTTPAKPVQAGQTAATNFVDQWLPRTDETDQRHMTLRGLLLLAMSSLL